MSKLAVTRCTSSWSSSVSIRRRFWRAWCASTSTVVLGCIVSSADSILHAGRLERLAHRSRSPGRCTTSMGSASVSTSSAPASMATRAISSAILAVARHGDDAARLELPGDGARAGQLAAGLGEHRAHVGRGAVLVVGGGLDEDRHAARAVALVDDLLVLLGRAAADRLLDGALDVVGGHVDGARLVHRQAQPVVGVGIAAALRAPRWRSRGRPW